MIVDRTCTLQGDPLTLVFSIEGSGSALKVKREYYGCRLSKGNMYELPVSLILLPVFNSNDGFCAWRGSSSSGVLATSPYSPTDGYQRFPHF